MHPIIQYTSDKNTTNKNEKHIQFDLSKNQTVIYQFTLKKAHICLVC